MASQAVQAAATAGSLAATRAVGVGETVPVTVVVVEVVLWPGVSRPQAGAVAMFSVSGTWLGTVVNGVMSGVLVKAPYIGVAAASFSLRGWAPRICSIVRTMVIWE